MGRQQDKCQHPCEKTIVYFGFPFSENGNSGLSVSSCLPTNNKTHNNLQRKLRGQLNWPCQTLFEKSSESDQRFSRLHIPKVGFLCLRKQLKARIKSSDFQLGCRDWRIHWSPSWPISHGRTAPSQKVLSCWQKYSHMVIYSVKAWNMQIVSKQKQKQINFVSHKLLEISRVFEVED